MVSFLIFIFDAFFWFERGGLFSLISAVLTVDTNSPYIDVDKRSLWVPILFIILLATLSAHHFLARDLGTRRIQAYIIIIMAMGFLINAFFGEKIITQYMLGHGYSRCESQDHEVGKGKGSVSFADYVRNNANCPAKPSNS